ncbi:MAG: transketolase, partial [Betaproteobacteria bacterium]
KLVCFYDDNGISIDGKVAGWFTDDTPARFAAYGWHVVPDVDGHDVDAVDAAICSAHATTDRPTLICCKTIIGRGSPNRAGTDLAHGQALGEKEVALTREAIGWSYPPFEIPQAAYDGWNARECGELLESGWKTRFASYEAAYPALAAEFRRRLAGSLPPDFAAHAAAFAARQNDKAESIATRKASQQTIEAFAPLLPELIGGAADLTGSVFTNWSGSKPVSAHSPGNYVNFGVREFAMSAIASGLTLHGGFIPYVGTFLTFSDYARNAVRMASLMRIRTIFVYTHDSIGLGEDGPTHQSIEHASALRLIPHLDVWRPCDSVETAVAWAAALERQHGATCLLLTRQNVAFNPRSAEQIALIRRGAYVLADAVGARATIIATGSEVALAVGAQKALADAGVPVRVVSMPCCSVFDRQDTAYRAQVLPLGMPRIAVEAGVTDYWHKYVGAVDDPVGGVVGIDRFGESAPAAVLFKHFGFTVEHVVAEVRRVLA